MRHHSNLALHKLSIGALALALFVLAPPARALVTVSVGGVTNATTSTTGTGSIYYFGLAACEGTDPTNHPSTVTGTYDYSATTEASEVLTVNVFAATTSACVESTEPDAGTTFSVSTTGTDTGSFSVSLPALLFGTACTASSATSTSPGQVFICVTLTASGATTLTDSGFVEVEYSMVPPAPPDVSTFVVEPGNNQLHVSWMPASAGVTIDDWHLYAEPDPSDGGTAVFDIEKYSTDVTSGTSGTLSKTGIDQTPLVNGSSYSVAISATDSYGNESALSGISPGHIPYPVDDFYQYYRDDGGSALGCASSDGAAWMALIAGVLFVLRSRKSRRGAAGIVLGLAVFAAGSARAGDSDYQLSDFTVPIVRAPRRVFFGLELDRYKPQVDSEQDLDGATPYMKIFGHRVPWRVQAELGLEAVHSPWFGTFVVGVSGGFWQNIGKGIYEGGPANIVGTSSSDTTLFDIWPVGVEAQLRLDMFTDRMEWFPLIPYAKAGLMGGVWVIYSGNGDVSSSPSTSATPTSPARTSGRGEGITYGYTTALGCAVALDSITPGISNEAYQDLGLQRTSLFAEYGWTRLDGFHSSGNLILTDRGWRFGLSLEF